VTAWVYRAVWRAVLVNLLGIGLGVLALILLSPFWIWRVVRRRPWIA
jgi:hypothetical protein